jgi:hypothetical protein
MTEQVTKNQHYIPQCLLVHFADTKEKLFEAFLQQKKVFPTTVANTMSETYTYEHNKLPVNTIENYFSKIEGEVSPLVIKLIESIAKLKNGELEIGVIKENVAKLLNNFLVFYYRSGALLTEFSSANKGDKIPLLSEKILDHDYINKLSEAILKFYDFALIESSDDFLLSDQFISTSALKIKTQFSNLSNRHIGLNETIILIPISSSFYAVFWNTKGEFFIKKDQINTLSEDELKLVNNTIINNSYIKCVSKKAESIKDVLDNYRWASPTNIYAGGNPSGYYMGATKKKEVFFFEEERKAYELLDFMSITMYRNLGRNDICACNSGKKFKKCHLDAYNRINTVMLTFGRSQRDNMRDFLIYGIPIIEKPVDEWSGFSKDKNQVDA